MIRKILYTILVISIIGLSYLFYIGDKTNTGERNAITLIKDKVFNTQKEPVNLIICWTPLQMVIAEKIIDQNPNDKFYIVLISQTQNKRFNYYFNRLKGKSIRALEFYYTKFDKKSQYISIIEPKIKGMLLPEIKTIYIASIDRPEVRAFMSSLSSIEIKTFDDGTINLVPNSPYLGNSEVITNKRLLNLYRLINSRYTIKKVRESSKEHFTIFKDLPNIMEKEGARITYLPLFDYQKLKKNQPIKDTVKILLGTAEENLKETSEKALENFNIKYTTLHPRQNYRLDNAITLESNLIIEDYLLREIEKNPHTQYEVYTFFSGAALILKDFPNVKVFGIKPTSLPDDYWLSPVYELFEKAQIPILELNDN